MKKHTRRFVKVVLTLLVAAACQSASAQDNQLFTVDVPVALTMTGPADDSLTHDETDNDQVFAPDPSPANHWQVLSNSAAGATVNLQTTTAFTNGTYKRDAKLDLAVSSSDGGGSPVWTVSTASDQTDYVNTDETATVTASSAGPGKATLGLTVTFITDTYSTMLAGNYTIDVVGTISAN